MISLVSDADHMKGHGGSITMMTLHAAKGLEFPVVAMIGLEEGCLPHSRARESAAEMEEERRLCFVGITRAEERLILTKAASRMIRGITERTVTSPFLAEMPMDRFDVSDRTAIPARGESGGGWAPASRMPAEFARFKVGQRVRSERLGVGKIVELTEGDDPKAAIDFGGVRKTLFLRFAKLQIVN